MFWWSYKYNYPSTSYTFSYILRFLPPWANLGSHQTWQRALLPLFQRLLNYFHRSEAKPRGRKVSPSAHGSKSSTSKTSKWVWLITATELSYLIQTSFLAVHNHGKLLLERIRILKLGFNGPSCGSTRSVHTCSWATHGMHELLVWLSHLELRRLLPLRFWVTRVLGPVKPTIPGYPETHLHVLPDSIQQKKVGSQDVPATSQIQTRPRVLCLQPPPLSENSRSLMLLCCMRFW